MNILKENNNNNNNKCENRSYNDIIFKYLIYPTQHVKLFKESRYKTCTLSELWCSVHFTKYVEKVHKIFEVFYIIHIENVLVFYKIIIIIIFFIENHTFVYLTNTLQILITH